MSQEQELLRCPFCGRGAELRDNPIFPGRKDMAHCRCCGACAHISKWNTRSPSDPKPLEGVSIKGALSGLILLAAENGDLRRAAAAAALAEDILALLQPTPSAETSRRPPDEVTEQQIRSRAKALVLQKGWKPGDRPGLHSVAELMVALGMDLMANPATDRCSHPECGCDFDAVCDAALSTHPEATPSEREALALAISRGDDTDVGEWDDCLVMADHLIAQGYGLLSRLKTSAAPVPEEEA